ncbi:hypothetical protein [Aurantimonas sp. 22II-16-19i]|uniref:hypothetical protein n=1 Tax=Aurantimonas sp. 22II-16-19i TaxID=1317114 RepID=UPI001FD97563|nr:hypothetical protein [Aurantimonas sp. 22II-16-19i]
MRGTAFDDTPDQVSDIAENHPQIEGAGLFGIEERWSMPVGIWRARRGFDVRYRPHDHATLSFVRSGGPVERLDGRFAGRRGGAHPDSFMLYPGGETRRYKAEGSVSICQIYFKAEFVAAIFEENTDVSSAGLELRDDRILTQDAQLRRMVDFYVDRARDGTEPPSLLEAQSHSTLLTIHLLRHHSNRTVASRSARMGLAPKALQRVLEFIEAHLAEDVSLARLAGIAGLSPRYFLHGLPPVHGASTASIRHEAPHREVEDAPAPRRAAGGRGPDVWLQLPAAFHVELPPGDAPVSRRLVENLEELICDGPSNETVKDRN